MTQSPPPPAIQPIFGAGFLGIDFSTPEESLTLLEFLTANNISRIDTARRYPALSPGLSETTLGSAKAAELGFEIDTKIQVAAAAAAGGPRGGSLSAGAISASVAGSLAALGVESVHVLHCHAPDSETPVEETATALDELFRQGRFMKLGLANYDAAQVQEFVNVCEQKGLVKPSVYQGQYNALCRRSEADLMPMLRKHGIVFNAYSPLAGGFLTGKLTSGEDVTNTRFAADNKMGAAHQGWYDKPVMHEAVGKLQSSLKPRGLGLAEVALRWLFFHSALREGDGVVLGGSKIEQLEGNLRAIRKGPLSGDLVGEVQKMWDLVESEAP